MDRILFRKRTASSAQKDTQPYPHNILKKSPSHQSFGHQAHPSNGSRRTPEKANGVVSRSTIPDKPPSLDVDIRNSLILPGLSQRFSVLLPSLSTAPEITIRDLLASQRARDGPSLTSEEEELLFQEIHESSQSPEDEKWNGLPNSLSLPDRLHHPPSSAPLPTSRSAEWQPSPPPTSNSFASFQTFGKPGATSPKSYGGMSFSSGSTVRDSEVMRKKAKNHANNVSSPESSAPKLPEISVDKANDYYHSRKASTSGSEESATPTTAAMALPKVHSAASSSTHLADLPPQLPAPTGLLPPTPARAKRASLLAGLTPAQVKRISSALGEIQQRLQQTEPVHNVPGDDDVEVLDPTPVESAQRQRLPSDVSTRSTASSAFPFGVSPTGSSFTANMSTTGSTTATPPKLSHSPRSHNLQAHVQPERAPPPAQPVFARAPKPLVPQPILTPSRTIPARHTPSLSLSSGDLSPVPVYVPGQPRPVGSMHRSDGSVSSRSATPTHGEGLTLGHARADSTPAPRIAQRSTSLGRSRSVNQTYTPTKSSLHESIGSASSKRPLDSRRLSSSLGSHSPRDDVIQEDEEEEDHRANYHRNDHPELRQVLRRSVAESKQSSLDQSPVPGPGNLKLSPTIPSCVPSQEGTMDESSDTHGTVETRNTSISVAALRSPTLRRSRSLDSLSSGFMEFDELGWEDIFSNSDSDMPVTPGDDLQAYAQTLKRLTGMGQEEFAEMQDKLVGKARQERRALREAMDESPLIPYSPPQRKESPMLAYERGSPQPTVPSPLILGPVMDRVAMPRRAAPPPPEPNSQPMAKNPSTTSRSEESEVVFTPATPGLTRKVSRRVAPENDPEIRRDFEARIAAATAALNRTPSNPSGSFSGKFSRTKAAVNISSPRLMSSSSNVPTTPLSTPEMDVAKALDKASGSSGKMSLRWKKLKKGLSFSGDGTPQSLPDGAPILEEPIALQKWEVQTKPATLTSPDINSFKFPNTAASDQTRYGARPALPLPDPPASAPLAPKTINADSPPDKFVKAGRAAGLDDDQLEEMIRVNGLGRSNSASAGPSLQRVLSKPESKVEPVKGSMSKAKGLLRSLSKNRKVEPLSTDVDAVDDSNTPTASTSARTFPIDSRQVVRRTLLIPTEGHSGINNVQDSPGQGSTGSPSAQRKASVRRKPLNLSQEDQQLVSETPSPHSRKFSMNSSHKSEPDDTPEPAENAGLGFLQPPSVMLRSTSQGTALTGASDVPSDRASSGGASFYDYYGEGEETLVSPNGPTTARPGLSRSSTQAVEITEYADGRMIWSLVDGLRHVDAADMIPGHSRNASYDSATPSDGDVFKADEPDGTFGPTAGLILRHKDRGQPAARPPTNVYYTSPADVADLIDHLSKDLEDSSRGRIDILPSRGASRLTKDSSPFGYANSQPSDRSPNANTLSTVSGQFEDAPSPRKGPPAPITVPKTAPGPASRSPTHGRNPSGQIGSATVPAAGFSPKRQLYLRHGLRGGSTSAQSGKSINPSSPGAASFNTSISGMSGMSGMSASKSVEDRLQALLDRLKDGGKEVKGEGEEPAFNVYA